MADNLTKEGIHVGRNISVQNIRVISAPQFQPKDVPAKNIRFKVQKPIQSFTGREVFLEELHKVVKEGPLTVLAPISVVAATGGIGKTEAVRMYIQLHAHEYNHIIWIDAEDTSSAKRQFSQLAREFNISKDIDGEPREFECIQKEIFDKLLQDENNVLLVFDNAEAFEDDPDLNLSGIRYLLPKSLSPFYIEPTVIVTSRNQNWNIQNVIQLDLWTATEVVVFVIESLRLEKTPENYELSTQLGNLFGRLPVALQAAVAVILQQIKRRKKYGIQNLIDEYQNGSRRVLAQKPFDANMRPTQTGITMLVLWNISLEKIVKFPDGYLAIKIICLMAYMSPTNIPHDFLHILFQNDYSQDSFENALEILEDFSLIASLRAADSDSQSFTVHCMIQNAIIENLRTNKGQQNHTLLNEKTFSNETEVLLKLCAESMNFIRSMTMMHSIPRTAELVDNLVEITNHVSKSLDIKEFRVFTEGVAWVLRTMNDLTKSVTLYERVLEATPSFEVNSEIREKLKLKWILASVYNESGDFQKSIELNLEVLEEQTRSLGPHHPDTLGTKGCIADSLQLQGKYIEAMAMFKEVLQGHQNIGDTHSKSFLQTKGNYARLLLKQGETTDSHKLLTEVLEEQRNNPDLNSGNLMATIANIASVLEAQGKLEEAGKIMEQNIVEATQVYGPFHLLTFAIKRQYANLLDHQGKHEEAASALLEILEIAKTHLGPHHPSTLATKNDLAVVYIKTEETQKAFPLLDVDERERVLGLEHPDTVKTANDLARVMVKQEKFKEALALYMKILKIRKYALGPHHLDTLDTMNSMSFMYYKMGEIDQAAEVAEDVLLRQEEGLGKDHPHTTVTLELLTSCRKILEERNRQVERFMKFTRVDAENGRNLLQASNWKLQVALDIFFHPNSKKGASDSEEQDPAIIASGQPPDAQIQNPDTISGGSTESSPVRDLEMQIESVSKPELTTSVSYRLEDGMWLRGQFGIFSTEKENVKPSKIHQESQGTNLQLFVNKPSQCFTGRKTLLDKIHSCLLNCSAQASWTERIVVLHGEEGVGKSELARQYIHLYKDDPIIQNVVWINAETFTSLKESFFQLIRTFEPSIDSKNPEINVAKVYKFFSDFVKVGLFVFDNAMQMRGKDMEILNFMPKYLLDHYPIILITSPFPEWQISPDNIITVGSLTEDEAAKLCLKQFNLNSMGKPTGPDVQLLRRLSNHLAWHPLALLVAVSCSSSSSDNWVGIASQISKRFLPSQPTHDTAAPKNDFKFALESALKVTFDTIGSSLKGKKSLQLMNWIAYLPLETLTVARTSMICRLGISSNNLRYLEMFSLISIAKSKQTNIYEDTSNEIKVYQSVQEYTRNVLDSRKDHSYVLTLSKHLATEDDYDYFENEAICLHRHLKKILWPAKSIMYSIIFAAKLIHKLEIISGRESMWEILNDVQGYIVERNASCTCSLGDQKNAALQLFHVCFYYYSIHHKHYAKSISSNIKLDNNALETAVESALKSFLSDKQSFQNSDLATSNDIDQCIDSLLPGLQYEVCKKLWTFPALKHTKHIRNNIAVVLLGLELNLDPYPRQKAAEHCRALWDYCTSAQFISQTVRVCCNMYERMYKNYQHSLPYEKIADLLVNSNTNETKDTIWNEEEKTLFVKSYVKEGGFAIMAKQIDYWILSENIPPECPVILQFAACLAFKWNCADSIALSCGFLESLQKFTKHSIDGIYNNQTIQLSRIHCILVWLALFSRKDSIRDDKNHDWGLVSVENDIEDMYDLMETELSKEFKLISPAVLSMYKEMLQFLLERNSNSVTGIFKSVASNLISFCEAVLDDPGHGDFPAAEGSLKNRKTITNTALSRNELFQALVKTSCIRKEQDCATTTTIVQTDEKRAAGMDIDEVPINKHKVHEVKTQPTKESAQCELQQDQELE